eukprot:CAMPEP_0182906340 /NCGR_PEP_ID=MMETSP0034_2-20130328/33658_1 /TAXON_ID=156128 /ORGANISM="Nephroselmis pyriformis, Strain CCMP717" /LENGTH=43 /DNA_ID= /DNA_START= /DNA_END= /DNA_ORIENTATION=
MGGGALTAARFARAALSPGPQVREHRDRQGRRTDPLGAFQCAP